MEKKQNLTAKWNPNIPVSWNFETVEDFQIIANIIGIDPLYRESRYYYEQYFPDVEWNPRLEDLIGKFKVKIGAAEIKKNKFGVLVSKEKINDQELVGANRNKKIVAVVHKELTRVGDSKFKSICPECRRGILTVKRNNETFELEKYDHCLLCGQRFEYLDIS